MTKDTNEPKTGSSMSRPMPKAPQQVHRPESAGKVRPKRSKARIQRHQGR